jgi:cytosine/creatinine deaminase
MLVLARHRGQSVFIGDEITVTVSEIRGDIVRLGFAAPKNVGVYREEIYEEVMRENRQAASMQPSDLASVAKSPPSDADNQATITPEYVTFMMAALDEAKQSLIAGGIPIGTVLVRDDRIIGRGHDRRIQRSDPTAQAPIECLRNTGPWETCRGTTMFCTALPSYFGAAALVHFAIPRLVVGCGTYQNDAQRRGAQLLTAAKIDVIDARDERSAELLAQLVRDDSGRWKDWDI